MRRAVSKQRPQQSVQRSVHDASPAFKPGGRSIEQSVLGRDLRCGSLKSNGPRQRNLLEAKGMRSGVPLSPRAECHYYLERSCGTTASSGVPLLPRAEWRNYCLERSAAITPSGVWKFEEHRCDIERTAATTSSGEIRPHLWACCIERSAAVTQTSSGNPPRSIRARKRPTAESLYSAAAARDERTFYTSTHKRAGSSTRSYKVAASALSSSLQRCTDVSQARLLT